MARCMSSAAAWGTLSVLLLSIAWGTVEAASAPPAPLDPTGMVNLDKNQAYTNALLCLQNATSACPDAATFLNETGKLHVPAALTTHYCLNCSSQTTHQLSCLTKVYPEFRFNDYASPANVKAAINTGCSITSNGSFNGNFTVTPDKSAGMLEAPRLLVIACSLVVPMALGWSL